MDTKSIRDAVLRQPFRPFTLRLNDGRTFLVPHPEFVAVSRRLVMLIDPDTEAGIFLEPILIASMKYEPAQPEAGPNNPSQS
jgi:hypothetical protein